MHYRYLTGSTCRAIGLALILICPWTNRILFSAEVLDFSTLNQTLHSLVTNRQTSDAMLLQAISRLGPVTEPPSFWWKIIDDSGYTLMHRTRALYALFRRHAESRGSVKDLRSVMGTGVWIRDATVSKFTYFFGSAPVEINGGESVFRLTVFGSARIYIRVLNELEEEDFVKCIRGEKSHEKMDPVVVQYGYDDDYDEWFYERPKYRAKDR